MFPGAGNKRWLLLTDRHERRKQELVTGEKAKKQHVKLTDGIEVWLRP